MRPNATEWRWTSRRERAAVLVAEDELPDHAIAAQVGVDKATLERWKRVDAFRERVAEHERRLEAEALRYAIAKRRRRVAQLDRDLADLNRLQAERAADPELAGVPGAATGLVLRTRRVIGTGRQQQVVEEFTADVALVRAKAQLMRQAAEELGQWSERHEHSGELLVRRYVGIDPDAV